MLQRLVDTGHRELFGLRGHFGARRQLHQRAQLVRRARRGAGDAAIAHDERKRRYFERLHHRADGMEIPAPGQRLEIRHPVEGHIRRVDNQIELTGQRLKRLRIAAVHHFIRAHRQDLLLFRRIRAERRHFAAHRAQQLDGDMAETTDANNADAAGGGDVMHQQRFEHRDATAQQRTGGRGVDAFRHRDHPLPVRANFIGETAAVQNGRHAAVLTVHLVAADTGVAVLTA